MKKEIVEIKDRNSVICYIQMLQNNISRMSAQSGIIKASMCVVYTILITIMLSLENMSQYWWIILVMTLIGAIIDSYYLGLERMYVEKYNLFINNINDGILEEKRIYDMKPINSNIKCEQLAMTLGALTSFSVWGFYIIFILISIMIKIF